MTAPLRVVHLSVVHRPDDSRICERECRTLAGAGYDVDLSVPERDDRPRRARRAARGAAAAPALAALLERAPDLRRAAPCCGPSSCTPTTRSC